MLKKFGNYILAKDSHAAMIAFFAALLPLFYFPTGFIASIVIGFVALQKGLKSGLFVLAWAALPTIALMVLRHVGLFDVLMIRCVLILGLALLLRRFHSWGILLEVLALLGIILIVLLHIFEPNVFQWWVSHLTHFANDVVLAAPHWKLSQMTPADVVNHIAPVATGVIGFVFSLGILFELVIARFWQASVTDSTAFQGEYIQIHIGRLAALIGLILTILMFLKYPTAIDIFPLVLLPFFVAGLSLMHFFVRNKKGISVGLILIYIGLFILPVFVVSVLGLIGFIDCFFDFRKKVVMS